MVANPKNQVVSQNLVEVGNPVVVESPVEVELLRLELLAMVLCLHLIPLSEIEGAFEVVAGSVEQDQFAKVAEVAENQVAEGAQTQVVDHQVEGERKVAEVEPLSEELVDQVVDLLLVVVAVFRPDTSKLRQSPVPSKCRPMPPEVALA